MEVTSDERLKGCGSGVYYWDHNLKDIALIISVQQVTGLPAKWLKAKGSGRRGDILIHNQTVFYV